MCVIGWFFVKQTSFKQIIFTSLLCRQLSFFLLILLRSANVKAGYQVVLPGHIIPGAMAFAKPVRKICGWSSGKPGGRLGVCVVYVWYECHQLLVTDASRTTGNRMLSRRHKRLPQLQRRDTPPSSACRPCSLNNYGCPMKYFHAVVCSFFPSLWSPYGIGQTIIF